MIPEIGSDLIQCLRGFYYSARLGSLTAASSKMGRNQSALSHQIKCLEGLFGAKLFKGDKRNRQLTFEGEFLLRKAVTLFELIRETQTGISQIGESLKGQISISTFHAVLLYFLPKYIVIFKQKHPLVDFVLEGATSEDILQKVSLGECDFGISNFDDLRPGLITDSLFKTRMVLVTPKQGPLVINHKASLEEISGMPFIAFSNQSTIRPFIQRLFAERGLSLKIVQEVTHFELIKKYVELGMGVSLLYDYALTDFDHNYLNIQSLDPEFPERVFGIIRRHDMHISPQLDAFLSFIKGKESKGD